jgi:signal transduction histidine kinase
LELAAKNEELESILFVASHDLRSPLVNIQGFSSELRRNCNSILSAIENRDILDKLRGKVVSTLAKDIPEALEYILTSSEKMDSLISGLLRLSRFGASSLKIEHLDMNKMFGEIVSSLEYQSQKAGVVIEIEEVPACWGDSSQINQVFSNLLDNALNYLDPSRRGVIKVYGRTEDGHTEYCIEDNGVGIAFAHQQKIFEIFHRLEPDKGKGEGLGLTIVRRILSRHKGKIWLESEPGKGSRFFVSLPNQIDE